MGTYYHQEMLRKQRMLERARAAKERTSKEGYDHFTGSAPMPSVSSQPSQAVLPEREPLHVRHLLNAPQHPIRHRKVDNTSADQISQFMKPEYKDYRIPRDQLPARRTHVKV